MAMIGDILVKFVADFAEFSQNMQGGVRQLEQFGKKADDISGQINGVINSIKGAAAVTALVYVVKQVIDELDYLQQKFTQVADQADKLGVSFERFEQLRIAATQSGDGVDALVGTMTRLRSITDQALQGNAATIDSLNKLGVTVLDYTGKQRTQEEINQRIAIAFEKMPASLEKTRLEFALLGQSGEKAESLMRLLATSSTDTGTALQGLGVSEAVTRIKQIEDRLKAAQERFDLLRAAAELPLKAEALSGWAQTLERLNAAIVANDLTKLQNLLRTLFSTKELFNLGVTALSEPDPIGKRLEDLTKQEAALSAEVDKLQQKAPREGILGHIFGSSQAELDTAAKKLADVRVEIGRLRAELLRDPHTGQTISPEGGGSTGPTPERPGANPPKVTTAGGGRTDAESIDAQIKRFQALEAAAKKTGETINGYHATNIEDFQREVRVQQQVEETAAKLGARYSQADDARKEALHNQIRLYEEAKDANSRLMEGVQRAIDIERKYGDGTAQAAKTQRDLNDAQKAGIANTQALARATKVQQEANEQARLEAKRYDDNLGSLAAGFEHAANAYSRANDLYSQGEQTFNALTSSMGEGLDALTGKSSKTFGQIAADFASMLARMALQAGTSAVFKWAFGSIFTPTANAIPTPAGSIITTPLPPLAGGRAVGGDVYPGVSYDVGESGPERFVPAVAGRVVPMRSNDNSGSVTVNLDMGQTQGAADPSAALEFGRRVRAAVVDVIAQEKRPGGTLYRRANA